MRIVQTIDKHRETCLYQTNRINEEQDAGRITTLVSITNDKLNEDSELHWQEEFDSLMFNSGYRRIYVTEVNI